MRVGLTHSRGALPGLEARLAAAGLEVEWQPLVSVAPRSGSELVEQAARLVGCDWLVFPSRSSVVTWFSRALPALRSAAPAGAERLLSARAEGGPALAATGVGTAAELRAHGREADLVGAGDARSTALALADRTREGERVGLVQGSRARPTLRSLLVSAGWEVLAATVYDTLTRPWSGEPAHVTVFASPSAVRAFGRVALRRTRPVAIGEVTGAELASLGLAATVAAAPAVDAVAAAVMSAASASARAGAGARGREARP